MPFVEPARLPACPGTTPTPGFSNTGVLTVMMLYLVAEGVTQTGGLDLAMNFMLGKASTTFWAQVCALQAVTKQAPSWV
jgi:hypothetical protein